MRQVIFNPPEGLSEEQLEAWTTWEQRSRTEQRAIKESYGASNSKLKFKSNVWKDLKDWLAAEVFSGKCAYCEGRYDSTDHGDAEHYRPKGNVTVIDEESGKKTKVPEHPGYYWLAYDWRNLVPACSKCNGSKSDQFPAKKHVHDPDADLEKLNKAEEPLLINPYFEDPNEHLEFDCHGMVHAKTPKGEATIQILDLNRERLIDERKTYIELSHGDFKDAVGDLVGEDKPLTVSLDKWMGEKSRFSQALRGYFMLRINEYENLAKKARL